MMTERSSSFLCRVRFGRFESFQIDERQPGGSERSDLEKISTIDAIAGLRASSTGELEHGSPRTSLEVSIRRVSLLSLYYLAAKPDSRTVVFTTCQTGTPDASDKKTSCDGALV